MISKGGNVFYIKMGLVPLSVTIAVLVLQSGPLTADWTGASDLSSGGDAENVRLSVDPAGNAYANWQLSLTNTKVIQSSLLSVGGSWTSPINVSDPSDSINDHELAVDWSGNAYAAWNPVEGGSEAFILATSRPSGFTWTAATILQDSSNDSDPRLAARYWGTAIAVWTTLSGANTVIQSSNFTTGAWVLPPKTISDPTQNANHAAVGVDSSGNAVAVWESNNGTNTIIQASLSIGGVWTTPYNLSYDGYNAESPQVAVNSAGNAVAIWRIYNGAN